MAWHLLSKAVDAREEKDMFALVIKEKTDIVGGWLEMSGEEFVIPFGEDEDDVERAIETQMVWSDWMARDIDTVQPIANNKGESRNFNPRLIESIAVVYTRS